MVKEALDRTEQGGETSESLPPKSSIISVKRISAHDYDPLGDGKEHPSQTPLVLDRNPETKWTTDRYFDGRLNKPGVGIYIDAEPARVRADVVAFAREASDLLDAPFDDANVEVFAGHAGPAYGVPHEATIAAIRLAGRLEALALDPVYSGKGLAGLIALIRQGRWRKDEDVIFLHTGGAPALFAYQSGLGI